MNQLERMTASATKDLESRIRDVYGVAQKDIAKKMAAWTDKHKAKDAAMRARLNAGEIKLSDYQKWLQTEVYVGKQWETKADDIANTLVNADREAARIINRETKDVFAEAANYALYDLEKGMGVVGNFGLYDSTTVDRLLRDTPELLPRRNINGDIDNAWQTKQVANAVTQGIIQGEGIPQISKRVAEQTGVKAADTTTRYARTAMTAAQNAGRQERMEEVEEELEEDGIEMQKMWVCTLDDRTRDAHQELDGVTIGVKEHFHNSIGFIDFPGDPDADDENVWNCRCTLEYVYPQFPRNRQRRAYRTVVDENGVEHRESYIVGDVTYKEWKEGMTEAAQVETPQVDNETKEIARDVEFTDVFTEEQREAVTEVLQMAEEEYPLPYELDFVGDARISRDLPHESIWDLRDEHPERWRDFNEAAKYSSPMQDDGTITHTIEIVDDTLSPWKLDDMYDKLYENRKEYDANPGLSHALFTAGNGMQGTVLHEYGHAVQDYCGFYTRQTKEGAAFEGWIIDYAKSNPTGILAISRYAGESLPMAVNPSEVWAEAFVTSFDPHHDTMAYRAADDIMSEFRKRFGHMFRR